MTSEKHVVLYQRFAWKNANLRKKLTDTLDLKIPGFLDRAQKYNTDALSCIEKLQNLMESVEDDDLYYKDDYCVRTLEDDLLN